jgi:hypothetical protein
VEEETKLVPVTVRVKLEPPAKAAFGFRDTAVGTGLATVNVNGPEAPPPGVGVETVTMSAAPVAMSDVLIAACKLVLETKVVERAPAFHWTVEEGTKFVPVTVSVNAALPTRAELGLRAETVGAGLFVVNVSALEVPPPGAGVKTVTIAVPTVAISGAVIAACRLVPETKVVVRGEPFQRTTEEEVKLEPVTVRVKAAEPAKAEVGLTAVTEGAGFEGGGC